jgi:hypothetical protein
VNCKTLVSDIDTACPYCTKSTTRRVVPKSKKVNQIVLRVLLLGSSLRAIEFLWSYFVGYSKFDFRNQFGIGFALKNIIQPKNNSPKLSYLMMCPESNPRFEFLYKGILRNIHGVIFVVDSKHTQNLESSLNSLRQILTDNPNIVVQGLFLLEDLNSEKYFLDAFYSRLSMEYNLSKANVDDFHKLDRTDVKILEKTRNNVIKNLTDKFANFLNLEPKYPNIFNKFPPIHAKVVIQNDIYYIPQTQLNYHGPNTMNIADTVQKCGGCLRAFTRKDEILECKICNSMFCSSCYALFEQLDMCMGVSSTFWHKFILKNK